MLGGERKGRVVVEIRAWNTIKTVTRTELGTKLRKHNSMFGLIDDSVLKTYALNKSDMIELALENDLPLPNSVRWNFLLSTVYAGWCRTDLLDEPLNQLRREAARLGIAMTQHPSKITCADAILAFENNKGIGQVPRRLSKKKPVATLQKNGMHGMKRSARSGREESRLTPTGTCKLREK